MISAGNLFSTVSYPVIDLAKGGTIQGVLDGLNKILDLAVAEYRSQGGTWIVPSRGRVGDTADVASYRNMLTMIRDRVQDLKGKGMTLAQVQAARPTMDFDGRYGSTTGPWTTAMFVEAVYRSLDRRRSDEKVDRARPRDRVGGAARRRRRRWPTTPTAPPTTWPSR